MNDPYHVFGNHENCATYFCKKKDKKKIIKIMF
jgi:hypothetical protein